MDPGFLSRVNAYLACPAALPASGKLPDRGAGRPLWTAGPFFTAT